MLYGLKDSVIEQILTVFRRHPQIEQAILYGSRAKGSFKNGSDIDLTLKGNQLNLQILNRVSNDLDDLLLPYIFDLSIFNQIQNKELLKHIDRVGIAFYIKN